MLLRAPARPPRRLARGGTERAVPSSGGGGAEGRTPEGGSRSASRRGDSGAGASGPVSAAVTDDAAALARQLFQWAKRQPKLKIIPAVERELVIQALKETNDNQVAAAKLLGITRATLRKRIEKFGIQRELNVK